MSRQSSDQRDAAGILANGFDYDLQVWVRDYKVVNCGHTLPSAGCGCNARKFAGYHIQDARALAARTTGVRVGSQPSHA